MLLSGEHHLCVLVFTEVLILAIQWVGEQTHCQASRAPEYYEYIIVGAGPGGLQLGYYLQQSGREYLVLEKANISGTGSGQKWRYVCGGGRCFLDLFSYK